YSKYIQFGTGAAGKCWAIRIKAPGTGEYKVTLDYIKNFAPNAANVGEIYIVEAPDTTVGGGGLNDVYMGQVMLAVRPNWSFTSATRLNLVCVVRVKVNLQGEVEKVDVTQSSGNAQYDSSAANAIWRTSRAGAFPPPPSEQYTELDLVFTLNELMGR
ncbi:MAG: TonB C-terminal domain-containing protein, partial [Desulfovibrio sp.]|nr:TonB C-terminal domain-containing protein [Desulfovibrio sp.]